MCFHSLAVPQPAQNELPSTGFNEGVPGPPILHLKCILSIHEPWSLQTTQEGTNGSDPTI